jgi:CubicO group peptidase (beta-lactamase class C family)
MRIPFRLTLLSAGILAVSLILPTSCNKKSDNKLVHSMDSLLAGMDQNGPGGSFLILKDDLRIYQASFGVADIVTNEPFTPQTVSNTGSISKTFVAYAILILQQQGKLSVNDSIIKYFPDFANQEIAQKVRIIHLLTHSSGLPDSRNVSANREFFLTAGDAENFAPLKLTETLLFEPGSKWEYSNPAYNGLALIVEQVSGMSWREFVRENVFKPSGMEQSKITDGAYPDKGVAHGYQKVNNVFEEYDFGEYPTFNAAGNGGVWCSVEEFVKYVSAIENCLFLDCETIALSKRIWEFSNWRSPGPPQRGISWVIHNQNNPAKSLCIEHSGSQGGFRAHLLMYPDEQITIIWLTNNDTEYTTQIQTILTRQGYIK